MTMTKKVACAFYSCYAKRKPLMSNRCCVSYIAISVTVIVIAITVSICYKIKLSYKIS